LPRTAVDAVYRQFVANGVEIPEPQNQPWGDRTTSIDDPDGNSLTFFQNGAAI